MNNIKNIFTNYTRYPLTLFVAMFAIIAFANLAFAASVPTLILSNNTTSIGIGVTGADPNAVVNFYFPNTSIVASASNGISYTSIDIGQTNSSGSFSVNVAPNSYGLNGGSSVYVSVDGANSSQTVWPTTSSNSGQSGSLSLSQQNVTLVNGQTVNIFPMNIASTLTVQGNSNSSIASAYFQSNNDSVMITGLNTGSTVISICAGSAGCSSVNVTVTAPTQAVTFSLQTAYVVVGQPAQAVGIYGPGTYNGLTNTNKDTVSATINGTNLMLQGLVVGQSTVSVCADGYLCGSIVVNSLSPGSAVPNQNTILAPVTSGFNQPPQLSSMSISSNDVSGLFFGIGSTISVNFGTNVTVTNVNVMIAGTQGTANQGANGLYYTSYKMTGDENLPLPVSISFVDLSGRLGHIYFWLGNSSTAPTAVASVSSQVSAGISSSNTSSYTFNNYLYLGMNKIGQSDPDVVALQNRLIKDGLLSSGSATGYFGSLTKAAVIKYQKKNGLSTIGVIGPATRNLLNKGI